ncbi:hypothetical protein [Streptomyces sp. NBC_00212]|uniref:hypothetical protein n=1 Tax=Streptomyces sp. NBC_00212 TaxID=2975684 RepID=UPI002F909C9E
MPIYAGLRVAGGTARAVTPDGVEVLFVRNVPQVGHRIGALPEADICDYDGVGRTVLRQDLWLVEQDANPPGPYEIEAQPGFGDRDNAWAVIATPSRRVAACRMEGAGKYLGTREQAQQWADALNEKFAARG